jgi:hypothetical protein
MGLPLNNFTASSIIGDKVHNNADEQMGEITSIIGRTPTSTWKMCMVIGALCDLAPVTRSHTSRPAANKKAPVGLPFKCFF